MSEFEFEEEIWAYKIYHTKKKLYSTGGAIPHFNKFGKIWSSEGHVKSHLTLYIETKSKYKCNDLETWIIIAFSNKGNVKLIPAKDLAARPAKK